MKGAKFKMGQTVRCVNEQEPKTIVGITENGGYHYNIEHYGGNRTNRVAETALVDFKTGK